MKSTKIKFSLGKKDVKIFNHFGRFNKEGSVDLVDGLSFELKSKIAGKFYVIATGSRPKLTQEGLVGLENAITSDDIFSMQKQPKKALVIGGGLVGTELASFL